ncbi:hydrogenase nickel incorporation protein [Anaerohalosphaera lusitana]|uniref:Hydrogenase maturation factor HypA n=1 Tax=Anaerohalosphaera lusitana TaxID=1936003 RepID=A0A1U9NHZ0_9BACT|nr:hydrogenase maturation nickel metallochaperone HypA [Anaerohalosphaera lusitana]AQT67541.1 hydrogenase nickel incorporation protein [Anaerohalosphaera lusitana]
MHETAVAKSIFDSIVEQAKQHNKKPVRAVVSCGQFNALNDEVLTFAFETIAQDSVCEGMKLEVKHIPLKASCKKCGTTFDFDMYSPLCPECESVEFDFSEDAPLLLEEIELADDENSD